MTFLYVFIYIIFFFITFFNFNLYQLFLLNGLFSLGADEWLPYFSARLVLPHSMDSLFFFLISLVITSTFCMLSFKKLMNSLIHLILIFIIMGVLLLLLNFDFLAVLTILIYVGAIMVFFLFAILLLLKFFTFKVMTVSKNKLISSLDFFLVFYFFLAVIVLFYSMVFSSRDSGEPFYFFSNFGFVEGTFLVSLFASKISFIPISINPPSFFIIMLSKVLCFYGFNFFIDFVLFTNFNFKEFVIMDILYEDVTLINLAKNLSELDLIHIYGFQLYTYYGFLLIGAAILLSIVIFAALKISKPFKSISVSRYAYK